MFYVFASLSSSAESFVFDEMSHQYAFKCGTSPFDVDMLPSKGMFLNVFYYSNNTKIDEVQKKVQKNGAKMNVEFEQKENYHKAIVNFDENDFGKPVKLGFVCSKEGDVSLVLRAEQSVTSDATLLAMIVTCIIIISCVILIVCFQFLTFHHRKMD